MAHFSHDDWSSGVSAAPRHVARCSFGVIRARADDERRRTRAEDDKTRVRCHYCRRARDRARRDERLRSIHSEHTQRRVVPRALLGFVGAMTSTSGAPQSRAKRLAANREASAASRARKREIEREMRAKCAYLEMHLEHARAHAQTLALENAQLKDALLEMTCGVKPAIKYAAMPVMAGKVAIPADPRVWDLDAWRKTKEDVEKGEKKKRGETPSDSDEDASMGCVLGNLDFDLTPESFADTYTEFVSGRTRRSRGAEATGFCEDGFNCRRRDFTRFPAHKNACEPRADIYDETNDMLLANENERIAKNPRMTLKHTTLATLMKCLATPPSNSTSLVNSFSNAASTTQFRVVDHHDFVITPLQRIRQSSLLRLRRFIQRNGVQKGQFVPVVGIRRRRRHPARALRWRRYANRYRPMSGTMYHRSSTSNIILRSFTRRRVRITSTLGQAFIESRNRRLHARDWPRCRRINRLGRRRRKSLNRC